MMRRRRSRRQAWTAWGVGLAVLAALAVTLTMMFERTLRTESPGDASAASKVAGPDADAERPDVVQLLADARKSAGPADGGAVVRGVVSAPDGRPASSATVTLYRVETAWPEWRKQRVDEAITREDGRFQFRVDQLYGHLIECRHPQYAGELREVSIHGDEMRLQLQPSFTLFGFVVNDVGAAVPNARVSLESVPRDRRRARHTFTEADGRYRFTNLAAGPVRLVARHESWQPAVTPTVVIGDRRRSDFRFERPTMSPLRGRVVAVATQAPIEGATVELVPINQQPGLVDPIATETDADGVFLLEGLPRGSMRMFVRHPEHGAVIRTQTIGAVAQELSVELPSRTLLRGQLVTEWSERAFDGGETLELRDAAGELQWTTVAADGTFAFARPLSPGFGDLRVLDGAFSFRRSYEASLSVRLEEDATTELEVSVVPSAVVRGRFVDGDGAPIAGVRTVRTRLLSESVKLLSDAAWELDAASFGGGLLQLLDVDRDQLLDVSRDDGTFEVRGFKPGPLLARATVRGRGSKWLRLSLPDLGEVGEAGDVVLPPGCSIRGSVRRGRLPFAGATVTVVSRDCQSMATTDAGGRYLIEDLVPGEYSVQARIIGRPVTSSALTATVAPGAPAERVDIELEQGRTVRGYVRTTDGRPLADALVSVRGRSGEVSATNASGQFEVELPRRDMELVVSFGDRTRQQVVPIAASQESVVVRLDTPPTATVVGRLYGLPGRRRLSGVVLRVTPLAGEARDRTRARWVPTPDGRLHKAQIPAGPVRVELWCDGYAPHVEERVLSSEEDNDLGEVLLEPGSRLRGVVRDEDGAPVRDAAVLLGEETDFDLFSPAVRSDERGEFEIRGVTSRSRHLVVRHPAFAARTVVLELPRDVLSLEPLDVRLERGATIAVTVPRDEVPDEGVVFLRRGGRVLASAVLDERGRAWFANRSAGVYTVALFGSDLPEEQVTVEPGVEVVRARIRSKQ